MLRTSLSELQRAIGGQVVMSAELEAMYNALLLNQVGDGRGGCLMCACVPPHVGADTHMCRTLCVHVCYPPIVVADG